jgi:spoIIIJ-associated protein
MSKTYEFKGKNIEQALEMASEDLNIPAEKIKHEVLAYGSSGIFGLVGVKKAKIKVFVEEEKSSGTNRSKASAKKPAKQIEAQPKPVDETFSSPDLKKDEESVIASGVEALQKIVDGITSGAKVETTRKREKLFYNISGGDSGVMIGKRGQTLEAIQYLLEKMINKKSVNRVRVVVDVEGYLEKRKMNLKQMASRMAEKAKRIKKPVTIGQMNAHDRRIVHIHLKDENGVRTQSIGDGYFRKLMIFPKKQGGSNRRKPAEK